jgi:hypothetical protein
LSLHLKSQSQARAIFSGFFDSSPKAREAYLLEYDTVSLLLPSTIGKTIDDTFQDLKTFFLRYCQNKPQGIAPGQFLKLVH